MKLSLNWLREFVEIAVEPRRLQADLKGLGLGGETVTQAGDDWVFELEITTNRPDCLSHYGVARELTTLYRANLKQPLAAPQESAPAAASVVSIEIADPQLCARYCGRVVKNLQVRPSPARLTRRLDAVGVRPINNVADVTNYVLMELGHPLHAFDLARLRGPKIVVRRARAGETLRTLDGVDRALTPENLVIADTERPVALAGVMGGEDSEISASTQSVLLESAWFDPLSIRRTAKAHGLHTEASHRFERGADIEMARRALDRAAALIAELAGGECLQGALDVYPQPKPRAEITLRSSEVLRILGAEIPPEEIEYVLHSLGFQVEPEAAGRWGVTPPSWRLDVEREADLIEEVARHYGYDCLPTRVRPAPPRVARDSRREKELTLTSALVALGYREIITSSMVDPGENARFTDRPPVELLNPLSQEASVLRSTAVPSMLRALRWNLDRDNEDLRLFEIGKTYTTAVRTPEGLPEERRTLTLGTTGHRRRPSPHDSERKLDFFDLKGDLQQILEGFDIPGMRFEPAACFYYEHGLAGRFLMGREALALFGQLNREIAREHKLRQEVELGEVDLERLMDFPLKSRTFHPFSKFPAVRRDFSLLAPEGTPYEAIEGAVRSLHLEEVQDLQPVDLYRGGSVPAGYYSVLLRMTFQSHTHTLTGDEIEAASKRILAAVELLGARVRS